MRRSVGIYNVKEAVAKRNGRIKQALVFTREDSDNITEIKTSVNDLKEALPSMLELASKKGAASAISEFREIFATTIAQAEEADKVTKELRPQVELIKKIAYAVAASAVGILVQVIFKPF